MPAESIVPSGLRSVAATMSAPLDSHARRSASMKFGSGTVSLLSSTTQRADEVRTPWLLARLKPTLRSRRSYRISGKARGISSGVSSVEASSTTQTPQSSVCARSAVSRRVRASALLRWATTTSMAGIRVRVVAVVELVPRLDAGHDDADRALGEVLQRLPRGARLLARRLVRAHAQDDAVHARDQLQRVAHGQQRRRVQDDDVIRVADLLQERSEALRREQLGGPRRRRPRGDGDERWSLTVAVLRQRDALDHLGRRRLADQVVRKPRPLLGAQPLGHRRAPQVAP